MESAVANGETRSVDFAVTTEVGTPSLWWVLNQAEAYLPDSQVPTRATDVTPYDICNAAALDPALCSAACYIVPAFCDDESGSALTRLVVGVVREQVGYPELEIRDNVLAETRGGRRAIDLYYEQSANAAAAIEADSAVGAAALAAGDQWRTVFEALAEGTASSLTISQEAVDATLAFATALRAAAGPELAALMDRELPRLDLPSWVGMSADEIVKEAASLTCEGYETTLFCGEINGDCVITATDALAVLRIAVGSLPPIAEADLDGSGSVTATDALKTLVIAVGIQPNTNACNVP
jgi:hypothetical protein